MWLINVFGTLDQNEVENVIFEIPFYLQMFSIICSLFWHEVGMPIVPNTQFSSFCNTCFEQKIVSIFIKRIHPWTILQFEMSEIPLIRIEN